MSSQGHRGNSTSSLIDTWILLRDIELGGERNRSLYVLKSRGMAHSNQVREFLLTEKGIELRDVYVGPQGVLTGSMRLAQEARERSEVVSREQEIERKRRELARKRLALEAQIAALRASYEQEEEELKQSLQESQQREETISGDRLAMGKSRQAKPDKNRPSHNRRNAPPGGRK